METNARLAVVIMAAGKGTRLKSQRPKVLHEIGGKPLLAHVIAAASKIVAPSEIFVVIGHQAEKVRAAVASTGVSFVEQTEQLGTGHAIQCAREAIAGYDNILVLSGDVPLIRPETIEQLWSFHQAEQAAMTILTAAPTDPTGYGRILRRLSKSEEELDTQRRVASRRQVAIAMKHGTPVLQSLISPNAPRNVEDQKETLKSTQTSVDEEPESKEVAAIIEQKALTAEQQKIREINSGIYAFRTAPLLENLDRLDACNPNKEVRLTDMAGLLRAAGERVVAIQAAEAIEVLGANTIAELVALDATLRAATASRLMAQGVTIFRPETCVIDAAVEVAADTVIEPFVQLLGRTRIGGECRIRSYTVIENCTLGRGVLVRQNCVLAESAVADGAKIGPFAHLRTGSEIGEGAHVGNFVETKKAKLGKGAKANHLTYLGDADVGAGSNIGAGVITCNYDGVNKHKTRIGKEAFIGSDSTLVAPVEVGDGAYVGAGSCITQDVPAGALAVGRARQLIKEGWAAAQRAIREKE
jgi:bifunctional UDP-N-acetylglucosamine pyrophosphorylase/glucosamine-1-phosphate N-acetyltransferase